MRKKKNERMQWILKFLLKNGKNDSETGKWPDLIKPGRISNTFIMLFILVIAFMAYVFLKIFLGRIIPLSGQPDEKDERKEVK